MTIKNQNKLDYIEINPKTNAQKSVIWLHGLGADGHDFVPIVPELQLPTTLGVRFIFPHAPVMPVTLNNGYEMRAWFDIHGITPLAKIDKDGIAQSISSIQTLIAQEEARGITSENIVLAGFSQGAVIALITGLCFAKPLAGIMALSGFLPLVSDVLQNASSANAKIPILMAHGTQDMVVPYAFGKASCDALQSAGYSIDWHSYPMAHSVCAEEVNDMSQWLKKYLSLVKNK